MYESPGEIPWSSNQAGLAIADILRLALEALDARGEKLAAVHVDHALQLHLSKQGPTICG